MIIQLDDMWQIRIDGFRNHQPYRIGKKMVKDPVTGDKVDSGELEWKPSAKYYPNMQQALMYVIQENLEEKLDTAAFEEYLTLFKQEIKSYSEVLNA